MKERNFVTDMTEKMVTVIFIGMLLLPFGSNVASKYLQQKLLGKMEDVAIMFGDLLGVATEDLIKDFKVENEDNEVIEFFTQMTNDFKEAFE